MKRRSRRLTSEERQLWAQVAAGVRPLKGRALDPELGVEQPGRAGAPPARSGAPLASPAAAAIPVILPPVGPLERRTAAALRRGRQGIDAAIDLHGLRQADAHRALRAFLHRSQGSGFKVVLVITGKGAAGAPSVPFEERGVLRRVVPHWLRLPDLRPLVVGFEEAAVRHGGAGALYVRLRRARGPSPLDQDG
jgi:DNA-nicking Smr family endonuclease